MTNADKYLKDEVDIEELGTALRIYVHSIDCDGLDLKHSIIKFFEKSAKPTLTEDEKVLLRNMNEDYKHLKRTNNGDLYAGVDYFGAYSHLFQFIKPRRRI